MLSSHFSCILRLWPVATAWTVNKQALDDCIMRRMFYVPAFEIHGGIGGLFDYGPPGCAVKENMLALWRQHFILEDAMLQIECTTLTPYSVLKASGHVDKFEDLMVRCQFILFLYAVEGYRRPQVQWRSEVVML
jgi:glycyl-tRNA synthetase (class II)